MFSRRTWLGAVLATLASLAGVKPSAMRPRRKRPDTRDPEYKTRWIGHY